MAKYKRPKATTSFQKARRSQADVEKRNKIIMGVVISIIMVGSILAIFASQSSLNENELVYTNSKGEEFKIILNQNSYTIPIGDNDLQFYYHPSDLSFYSNETDRINQVLQGSQAVMLFDPEDINAVFIDVARFDITNALLLNNQYMYSVRTENSTSYSTLPIATCGDLSQDMPGIYFHTANKTSIRQEGNCLIMEGNQYDFIRYRDLIIYAAYGIMP